MFERRSMSVINLEFSRPDVVANVLDFVRNEFTLLDLECYVGFY